MLTIISLHKVQSDLINLVGSGVSLNSYEQSLLKRQKSDQSDIHTTLECFEIVSTKIKFLIPCNNYKFETIDVFDGIYTIKFESGEKLLVKFNENFEFYA